MRRAIVQAALADAQARGLARSLRRHAARAGQCSLVPIFTFRFAFASVEGSLTGQAESMISIRTMTIADYQVVMHLMQNTPGVSLRDADSREATARYLERNPGLSFIAEDGPVICGCVMCGHDGRRGYLQHLLVIPEYRHQGIASRLVSHCIEGLESLGIRKCHLDVLTSNEAAAAYWTSQGWQLRRDIERYSFTRPGDEDA